MRVRQEVLAEEKTLIFDDANLRHGFIQIPKVVLIDKRLSSNDKMLYALLLMYAWQDGECFPGQFRLSEDMQCDKKTLAKCLSHLKDLKYIKVERRGLGKTNIYHIRKLSDACKGFYDRG